MVGLIWGLAWSAPLAATPAQHHVLLVGNSYTRFNVMPVLLRRVAASVPGGPRLRVDSVAKGGYTLRMHWRKREARERIRRRGYTHVVLQGHSLSPLDRREEMRRYASRFGRLIEQRRARTVLYETWARAPEDRFYREHPVGSPDAMRRQVADTYARVAADLSAEVAPVGRAFELARLRAPELPLLRPDGSHPTIHGSYLAALVLYAAVAGGDPRAVEYRPWHVSPAQAQRMRALAHQVVRPEAARRAVAAAPLRGPGTAGFLGSAGGGPARVAGPVDAPRGLY